MPIVALTTNISETPFIVNDLIEKIVNRSGNGYFKHMLISLKTSPLQNPVLKGFVLDSAGRTFVNAQIAAFANVGLRTTAAQLVTDLTAAINTYSAANSGGVNAFTVGTPGTGYTTAPTVVITSSTGSGATATAVLNAGVAPTITVSAGGTGYTSATVSFTGGGGGTGATATANISGGVITSITRTAAGSGYSSPPTVVITGDGTGAAATCTIVGGVGSITTTAAGSRYATAPTISFTGGGGTGAAATATVFTNTVGTKSVADHWASNANPAFDAALDSALDTSGAIDTNRVVDGVSSDVLSVADFISAGVED